ncbi:hypothetical protein GDO81_006364 [Engystomops pustulosus]|uniref:Uncharacterized protein n=1 Tax=Engystomops pustulosus TaxID=76066 RepID=A0AAV7CW22_ENGPU|nr:hypothetical protein GDO81_006364 [Engystomops pustulosus]
MKQFKHLLHKCSWLMCGGNSTLGPERLLLFFPNSPEVQQYKPLTTFSLSWHLSSSIDPMVWSNHAAVLLTLYLSPIPSRTWSWSLNNNLLKDAIFHC